MLKVAVETWYTTNFLWTDIHWSRFFMQQYFKEHNIELVRVSINKFNTEKKYFTEYNIFDSKSTGNIKTTKKKYIPDIIRSRRWIAIYHKYEILNDFLMIPCKKIAVLGNDKYENYKFFSKYQPFTTLLSSFFSTEDIQKKFKGKIVIKPIRANSGKWIVLTTVPELLKKKKKYHGLEELYIVQQFKDFSKWCPWICTTNHDVRLMFAGKNIVEATLRIPKKWDFRSNVSLWWSQRFLLQQQIPKQLLSLSKKAYKELKIEDKSIFSIDFAYCKKDKQRYLIEINSSPGTWYYQTDKKLLTIICSWLVRFFLSLQTSNHTKII